ncbi:MAG: response regulator transcription factor [Rikenellaceae bacterium]
MQSEQKILLVDDEPDILEFVSYNLMNEGYIVECAPNGEEALKVIKTFKPHLILLDVMMPVMDGIETCERIRATDTSNVVISFLSARGEDFSQIAGYEAGADDYITKPIRPKLLVTKVKALLKRYEAREEFKESGGGFVIDRDRYCVEKDGGTITLPRKEFELLSFLFTTPDRVFTRDEIFKRVWGTDVIVGDRTIDVHIRKLREKIGNDYIQTIKGVGYKFVLP